MNTKNPLAAAIGRANKYVDHSDRCLLSGATRCVCDRDARVLALAREFEEYHHEKFHRGAREMMDEIGASFEASAKGIEAATNTILKALNRH